MEYFNSLFTFLLFPMKRFLLLLLLAARGFASLAQSTTPVNPIRASLPPFAFPTPVSASEQGPPLTAFADSINRIFQAVDKSRVSSGILEEYGLQFIDHTPFTGTNGYSAANQLNINRWRAIYGDLRGARINNNAAAMPNLAAVPLAYLPGSNGTLCNTVLPI